MITPEQVPDVVVDALLDSSNVAQPWHHAVAAALNAWPGMRLGKYRDVAGDNDRIILPLAAQEVK